MAPTPDDARASDWKRLALLWLALFGLMLLVPRDLWVQDEARYGEIVREMLADGEWWVPHLNGYAYPDKPPVYFWIVSLLSLALGAGELPFRLVSALGAAAAMAGVYQLARALTGRGLWAALLFATMLLSVLGGEMVRMDMLVVAVAAYAWLALLRHRVGASRALVAFWALTALGLALKGPITLLFTLLPALIWRAAADGWAGLRSLRLPAGLAALVLLVALWIAGVIAAGHEDYLLNIWRRQLVGRAIDSWSHKEPFYFYALLLPLLIMPWTALAVDGARRLYRERPAYALPVAIFTLVPLLGISLLSGKLFIYLLPLLPGVAIAAAAGAGRLISAPRVSGWFAWPPVLYVVLTAGVVGYLGRTYLSDRLAAVSAIVAALAALAAAGVWLWRQPGRRWLWGWVVLAVVHAWLFFAGVGSLVNPLFSARALGAAVQRHAAAATEVGVVHGTRGILNYYAGRKMTEVRREEAGAWVAAHPAALVILKQNEIEVTFGAGGIPAECRVHERFWLELKEFHVVAGCR